MAHKILLTIVVSLLYYGCASYDHTGFLYPNTISLSQDALNESWKLTYIPSEPGETLHSFRLDIYDAGNQRVFTSDNVQNSWNIPPILLPAYSILSWNTPFLPNRNR